MLDSEQKQWSEECFTAQQGAQVWTDDVMLTDLRLKSDIDRFFSNPRPGNNCCLSQPKVHYFVVLP